MSLMSFLPCLNYMIMSFLVTYGFVGMVQIEKDGEIGRLKTEVSELHRSKRQLIELLEQKDLEISEKNVTIKSYLDKIVSSLLLYCFPC